MRVVRGEVFGTGPTAPEPVPTPEPKKNASHCRSVPQEEWEKQALATLPNGARCAVAPLKWSPAEYVEYGTESGASLRLLQNRGQLVARGQRWRRAVQRQRIASSSHEDSHERKSRRRSACACSHTNRSRTTARASRLMATSSSRNSRPMSAPRSARSRRPSPITNRPATVSAGRSMTTWKRVGASRRTKIRRRKRTPTTEAVFVFAKRPEVDPAAKTIEFKMHHDSSEHYLIGRFRHRVLRETAPAEPMKKSPRCSPRRCRSHRTRDAERRAEEIARPRPLLTPRRSTKPGRPRRRQKEKQQPIDPEYQCQFEWR